MKKEPTYQDRLSSLLWNRRMEGQDRYPRPLRWAAAASGVNHATLARIESGRGCDVETLVKLCRWLSVSADSVLGLSDADRTSPDDRAPYG